MIKDVFELSVAKETKNTRKGQAYSPRAKIPIEGSEDNKQGFACIKTSNESDPQPQPMHLKSKRSNSSKMTS